MFIKLCSTKQRLLSAKRMRYAPPPPVRRLLIQHGVTADGGRKGGKRENSQTRREIHTLTKTTLPLESGMKRPVANSCLSWGDKSSRFNGLLLESLHLFAAESHDRHKEGDCEAKHETIACVRDLNLSHNNVSTSPNRLQTIASSTSMDKDQPFTTHYLGDFSTHNLAQTLRKKC